MEPSEESGAEPLRIFQGPIQRVWGGIMALYAEKVEGDKN